MNNDEELDAYARRVSSSSSSPLRLRPGLEPTDHSLARLPPEVASIWRWRDGQNPGDEFVPGARFLPLSTAVAEGEAMLRSRRALPDHPDHRPGTFWLAFVTDGTVAQIIEHGPDVATSALVFDPSGFVDDYPVVPVGDLLRLWRTTAVTRAWTWNGSAWRIDHTLYPDVPLRRLLLV